MTKMTTTTTSVVDPQSLTLAPILDGPYETWRERSLCPETDPEIFFPEVGQTTTAAKAVCGRCEVRADCLASALAQGEIKGVWGGLSEQERLRLPRPPRGHVMRRSATEPFTEAVTE